MEPAINLRDFKRANVITVLYNSASTLPSYMAALSAEADHIAELILVDNGSTDGSAELARALAREANVPTRVLESRNVGFAGGYLVGGRAVEDPRLPTLALNPDVILATGSILRMLAELTAHPTAGLITAPLTLSDGSPDPASVRSHPSLSGASLYAVLGKLTPRRWRYNVDASKSTHAARDIDATTGALMLVNPQFRAAPDGVFDTDYWMYGEDLQLCLDAAREGRAVRMVEGPTSTHIKGVSSGRPRSSGSNRAFHDAMYLYFAKNHASHRAQRAAVWVGIKARLYLSTASSAIVRASRRLRRREDT